MRFFVVKQILHNLLHYGLSKGATVLWTCGFVLKRVLCDSTVKRPSKCAISYICNYK